MNTLPEELLSAYVDGECTAEEVRAVEACLAVDAEWQAVLVEVREARAAVRALPMREPPVGFVDRLLSMPAPRRRRRFRLVGSGVGAAAAAVVAVLLASSGSESGVTAAVASLAGNASDSRAAITPASAPPDLQLAEAKYDVAQETEGRTTVYEMRYHGRLVARMYVDDTSDVVRMDIVDDGSEIVTFAGNGDATLDADDDLDAPLRDPAVAGDSFRLVATRVHEDGIAELSYSDGVLSVSVFEQRGDLDWDKAPAGGTDTEIAGYDALRYATEHGNAWVFEREGVVYTCVSKAPADQLVKVAADVSEPG